VGPSKVSTKLLFAHIASKLVTALEMRTDQQVQGRKKDKAEPKGVLMTNSRATGNIQRERALLIWKELGNRLVSPTPITSS